jgi:hypothetical protein
MKNAAAEIGQRRPGHPSIAQQSHSQGRTHSTAAAAAVAAGMTGVTGAAGSERLTHRQHSTSTHSGRHSPYHAWLQRCYCVDGCRDSKLCTHSGCRCHAVAYHD